jgi:hypothetical protein
VTLKADLARQDAARAYAAGSTLANERYWNTRRAEHAAMPDGASRDLVVAGAASAADGNVVVSRPQNTAQTAQNSPQPVQNEQVAFQTGKPSTSTAAPLSAESVTAFLAEHRSYDAAGVTALEQKWSGPDMASNLGYARAWLNRHLSSEQQERIRAAGFDVIPLYELIAQFGRDEAHAAPTTTTTTMKGPSPMSDENRPDALKRFRRLTADLHSARARMDHLKARELGDERDALSAALFPGDGSPDAEHSGKVIG